MLAAAVARRDPWPALAFRTLARRPVCGFEQPEHFAEWIFHTFLNGRLSLYYLVSTLFAEQRAPIGLVAGSFPACAVADSAHDEEVQGAVRFRCARDGGWAGQ